MGVHIKQVIAFHVSIIVCDCNIDGTVLTLDGLPLCDKDTGQCVCREGANGNQCDGCTVS